MPMNNRADKQKYFIANSVDLAFGWLVGWLKDSKSVVHAERQVKGKNMHKLIDKSVTQT